MIIHVNKIYKKVVNERKLNKIMKLNHQTTQRRIAKVKKI